MPSISVPGLQRALALAAVPLVALVFAPGLHSAFLIPKAFTLLLFTALLLLGKWPTLQCARVFWIAVAVWLLTLLLAGFHSSYPELRTDTLAFTVGGPLLLLGTQRVLQERPETWYKLLIATGVLIGLIVIAQIVWRLDLFRLFGNESWLTGRMRAFGTLGNPLFAGVFLAAVVVVAYAQAQETRNWWTSAAAFLIATGLACTGSRTALVAAAAGLILTTKKASLRNIAVAAALIGITFYAGTRLSTRSFSEAAHGRMLISRVSLASGISLLGSGPGSFAVTYPSKLSGYFADRQHQDEYRFAGYERHAHNEWTETLVESGAIGFATFVLVLSTWLWTIRREALTPPRRVTIAVVATLLFASVADFTFHRAETWALLWMAMGAALPIASAPEHSSPYLWLPRFVLAGLLLWVAFPPLLASRAIALGTDAEAAGDPVRAVAHYQAALRWRSASPDANFNLTRSLCKQGALNACWQQSEHARHYVDEAELYVLRARCLEAQGRLLEAGVELANARERFPFSKALQK